VHVHTIGFTQRPAADFFGALKSAGVRRVVDVRLNATSQLSAFAKQRDLPFFLHELVGAEYVHAPRLAPDDAMFQAYKNDKSMPWDEYAARFVDLLARRKVEDDAPRFDVPTALLCSEKTADRCHRRLVAEYLRARRGDVGRIVHL
jgi:uncharacterized protein (DUF488 family)